MRNKRQKEASLHDKAEPPGLWQKIYNLLVVDPDFKPALWIGLACFLVGYLGVLLIVRLLQVGGGASVFDSIVAVVFGLAVGIIGGVKRYRGEL